MGSSQIAKYRDLWQQAAGNEIYVVTGGKLGEGRRDDDEVIVRCEAQGLFARSRQRRAFPRKDKPPGRVTDGAGVAGATDLELTLCGDTRRRGLGERGLGLG